MGPVEGKKILALSKAVVATFDAGKWLELGHRTETVEYIQNHKRLLRSLDWGDPDYDGCTLQVIGVILRDDPAAFETIADMAGFKDWLVKNDPALHSELYGGPVTVSLEDVEKAASILEANEFREHVRRIQASISDDPAQAIGSAKELWTVVTGLFANIIRT